MIFEAITKLITILERDRGKWIKILQLVDMEWMGKDELKFLGYT